MQVCVEKNQEISLIARVEPFLPYFSSCILSSGKSQSIYKGKDGCMMKKASIGILLLVVSLVLGCNAHSAFVGEVVEPILSFVPAPTAHASAGSTALHIVSIDEESSARSSRSVEQNEFELWLMPVTYRGNEVVSHDNVRNIKRFVVTGDDPFAIPVSELPQSG